MQKITGIYKITNPKGSVYIGQSVNIYRRWTEHKKGMDKYRSKLHSSLKKYGFDNHKFEIIHQCNRNELDELEIYYISLYQSFDSKHGLNLTPGGDSNTQFHYLRSEESIRKQRESMKGNKRAFKPNKIRKEKQCDWGKNGCKIISSIKDGSIVKTYNSIADAALELGVSDTSISNALRGKTRSSAGYFWIYGNDIKEFPRITTNKRMIIETRRNRYIIKLNVNNKEKERICVRIINDKQLDEISSFDVSKDTNEYEILKECVDLIYSHELIK